MNKRLILVLFDRSDFCPTSVRIVQSVQNALMLFVHMPAREKTLSQAFFTQKTCQILTIFRVKF